MRLHVQTFVTDHVTSADGTLIGYRKLGTGPGLIILHGMAESAQSHMELAAALSTSQTVYLPDRRGRGTSGPFGSAYCIAREVEDLRAVLAATGAHAVFAVSAGAIVALETARVDSAIDKLAIMEPPFIVNGSPSTAFLERYDREIADGNVPGPLVTGMRAAQMGPALLRALPGWILEPLVGKMIAQQDKGARTGDVTMRMLAPTLHYDFVLVKEVAGPLDRYQSLSARLLLLDGSKSPEYFRASVAALARVLPLAQRVTFKGLGHEASGNARERGTPAVVAAALQPFFGIQA
jgi:hypothetical protein